MASMLSKKPKKAKKQRRQEEKEEENVFGRSLEELKTLGRQLISSRAHINNVPILLSFLTPSSPLPCALESLLSLQSFFTPLLPDLPPSSKPTVVVSSSEKLDPDSVYRSWLRSKFNQFIDSLVVIALSPQSEEALKDVALDAIMEFVKLGKGGKFQFPIYHKLLKNIVRSSSSVDFLLDLLASKFFKYIDVRYFTYVSVEKLSMSFGRTSDGKNVPHGDDGDISESRNEEHAILKMHDILSRIPTLEGQDGNFDHEMWSDFAFSSKEGEHKLSSEILLEEDGIPKSNNDVLSKSYITKKLKLKFAKAWISFLRLPLPPDVYKEVLVNLHHTVIPHMSNPVILCDFLTRSYDIGGVISVMALSSLFILMTQHGLEYPNFYEKLYALLVPAIFMAKHRSKFFQLLDTCLKSSLLPAYLAAAFTKKLSRLALSVPPSGALVIIAIIHNLLRRHPSINCLVHRADDGTDGDAMREGNNIGDDSRDAGSENCDRKPGIDPFNNEEGDPAKSNALKSSLWEIDTLRHHYCPAVSRFVASLENDLTVRAKTTEITVKDFSSGSYATVFRDEIRRRVKQVPLAFYKATPTSLFSVGDFPGWSFVSQRNDSKENNRNEVNETNPSEDDHHVPAKKQRIECC